MPPEIAGIFTYLQKISHSTEYETGVQAGLVLCAAVVSFIGAWKTVLLGIRASKATGRGSWALVRMMGRRVAWVYRGVRPLPVPHSELAKNIIAALGSAARCADGRTAKSGNVSVDTEEGLVFVDGKDVTELLSYREQVDIAKLANFAVAEQEKRESLALAASVRASLKPNNSCPAKQDDSLTQDIVSLSRQINLAISSMGGEKPIDMILAYPSGIKQMLRLKWGEEPADRASCHGKLPQGGSGTAPPKDSQPVAPDKPYFDNYLLEHLRRGGWQVLPPGVKFVPDKELPADPEANMARKMAEANEKLRRWADKLCEGKSPPKQKENA